MAYNSLTQTFSADFSLNDWPTQLALFQALYNCDDIAVNYLDDENDEVKIMNQADLEYSYQIATLSSNNILKLILRNSRNEVIAKPKILIDPKAIKTKRTRSASTEKDLISSRFSAANEETVQKSATSSFTETEVERLVKAHLDTFKQKLLDEIDSKIKSLVDTNLMQKLTESTSSLLLLEHLSEPALTTAELEAKTHKLFAMIMDAKASGRTIKSALLEEELQSTGAFWAEFVKDCNMPDGSKCAANANFQKVWQIKNTGKLSWHDNVFPVKLICIGGTLLNNSPSVSVANTKVNETASISVDLTTPAFAGSFFSEWVLSCNGFQFGPRVWCTIHVVDENENQSLCSNYAPPPHVPTSQIFDTIIQMSNEMPCCSTQVLVPTSRCEFEQNINRASSSVDEDLDDEFVVVPDCFDLTKKWTPTAETTREADQEEATVVLASTIPSQSDNSSEEVKIRQEESKSEEIERNNEDHVLVSHSSSFADMNTTLGNCDTFEDDLYILNMSQTITVCHGERNKENGEIDEATPVTINGATAIDESIIEEVRINRINVPQVLKEDEKIQQEERETEKREKLAENNISNNNMSTFDKMKNALTNLNLGSPSFAGRFDLDSEIKKDDASLVRANLNRLLSMGFGNRALNERLLKKYSNNLDLVVQHLIEAADNNWSENR